MSKDRSEYTYRLESSPPMSGWIVSYDYEDLIIDFNCSECDELNLDVPVTLHSFICTECETEHASKDYFDNHEWFKLAYQVQARDHDLVECLRMVRASVCEIKTEHICKLIADIIGIPFRETRQVLEAVDRNFRVEVRQSLEPSDLSKTYGWFFPYSEWSEE